MKLVESPTSKQPEPAMTIKVITIGASLIMVIWTKLI